MDFNDFGIIDWFNDSKGYGVVKSTNHGYVFIHIKDIKGLPSKDNYVLIGEVNKNIVKNRYDGKRITIWDKDNCQFCEVIFQYWLSIRTSKFDAIIKWLPEHCNEVLLEKIINSNKDKWVINDEFLTHLENSCKEKSKKENELYVNIIREFFFELWEKTENKKFDKNLELAIDWGNREDILKKALEIDYHWINDDLFIAKFNDNRFSKKTVFDFLINKIFEKEDKKYNDDIKWIISNGNDSILSNLLDFKFLYSNNEFLEDFKQFKHRYSLENNSRFIKNFSDNLYELWKFTGDLVLTEDIKWIIRYGPSSTINKIFEINYSFWCTNHNFISFIREVSAPYCRILENSDFKEKYKVSEQTISILENFIFEVWNLQKTREFDENLKWLIRNGKREILLKIINQDKQKWMTNNDFVKYVIRSFTYPFNFIGNDEFKENFLYKLYEVCMFAPDFKYNETVKWVFENASLDKINKILTSKIGYNKETIEKIYTAFYPDNNIKYYRQKSRNSDWSVDFQIRYYEERETKIRNLFSKLFINELEEAGKSLTKRLITKKEAHAATDLANFVFCPASYAINQTFYIDFQENENVFIGTQEHEKQRLLGLSDHKGLDENTYLTESTNYYNDFNRIRNSKCISQGHSDKTPTIYYSKKRNLSGIPDYIFKDSAGFFAVEEKYTFKDYEELTNLYPNHKTQALVYLYGLDEFNFNEVFVLYWYINKYKVSGEYYVYNYRLFKLIKTNENKKMIVEVFNDLESIRNRVPYPFDVSGINYRKCIRCNYFPFCEYKKGKISNIELGVIN